MIVYKLIKSEVDDNTLKDKKILGGRIFNSEEFENIILKENFLLKFICEECEAENNDNR